jgi:hypothetical protein
MNLNIDVRGDDRVRAMLARISDQLAQRALAATAVEAEDYIEEAAGRHTKTGALFQSIYKNRIRPLAWELGHNRQQAPHALFVHWGTRPHVIKPAAKKALRWAGPAGFRFARAVNHPGYRGDPWLRRAAREAPRNFEAHVAQQLRSLST